MIDSAEDFPQKVAASPYNRLVANQGYRIQSNLLIIHNWQVGGSEDMDS